MQLHRRLLVSLLVVFAAPTVQAQPAPSPTNGRALAAQLCAGCHLIGPDARGPVPDGIPSFMAIAARPESDEKRIQAALISAPHPLMPSPPLDNRQMADVAAYVLTLRP